MIEKIEKTLISNKIYFIFLTLLLTLAIVVFSSKTFVQPTGFEGILTKILNKFHSLFQEAETSSGTISSKTAVEKVRTFAKKHTSIKISSPTAKLEQDITGEKAWIVYDRLPGKAADTIVEINAKTGKVTSYVCMRKESDIPGPLLSKNRALEIVKTKAKELGVPSSYLLKYVGRDNSGSKRPLWVFEWVKRIDGVEYFAASYIVALHADTGELAAYMKGSGNDVPYRGRTKPEISKKQAINKALTYIKSHQDRFNFSELKEDGTAKLVIGSRSFDKQGRTIFNAPPQLIWVINIKKRLAHPLPNETDFSGTIMVNVDAISGEVVGVDETM